MLIYIKGKEATIIGFNKLLFDLKDKRSQQSLAMLFNCDQATLSRKLNGKTMVTIDEAINVVLRMGKPLHTVCEYCEVGKCLQKNRTA
jgi:hypothetical protein